MVDNDDPEMVRLAAEIKEETGRDPPFLQPIAGHWFKEDIDKFFVNWKALSGHQEARASLVKAHAVQVEVRKQVSRFTDILRLDLTLLQV